MVVHTKRNVQSVKVKEEFKYNLYLYISGVNMTKKEQMLKRLEKIRYSMIDSDCYGISCAECPLFSKHGCVAILIYPVSKVLY